ncbi:MAG: hypothetical protein O2960_23220 [Verrucomicrobia bacterium]|nr:hypothetical protein [Verrucomicrobiota bacterium]
MKKQPHNPGVRDLVEAKRQGQYRQTQEDGRRGFRGWHERGYLPHFDAPGRVQFITFRLADSFPANLRSEWSALMEIENDRERLKQLEAYLDLGHGEAWLRHPEIAKLTISPRSEAFQSAAQGQAPDA